MKITPKEIKQIIKEELSKVLGVGMTKEDEDFLIDNDFSDPPMGLTDAQEKAYVDALREKPKKHDEIYELYKRVADENEMEYERGL